MIDNIKNGKVTTGLGLAVLLYLILKFCGINVEEKLGLTADDTILYFVAAVSGVMNLFTKDPQK